MPKKTKVSNDDINTFQRAVKGVKPLENRKVRLKNPDLPIQRRKIHEEEVEQEDNLEMRDHDWLPPVESDEYISFKQTGVSDKTLRKLRKGQYNVDAVLDLHGSTTEMARSALSRFIRECSQNQVRVALIIHGKGRPGKPPVIKNRINHWLRELPMVVAFCTATARHGHHGAIYVLLKQTINRE